MIDEYLWGSVDRISPEAPVPVVCVEKESQTPGGAGNVINNLVEKIESKISDVDLIILSDYDKGLITRELLKETVALAKKT
jgi:bifunctional ADP-heptose synthase (sugar kinase/adenylyltransferase)